MHIPSLGRVYGPYIDLNQSRYVGIVQYTETSQIASNQILPYYRYLAEYREGRHRYTPPQNDRAPRSHIANCCICGTRFTLYRVFDDNVFNRTCNYACRNIYYPLQDVLKRYLYTIDKQIIVFVKGAEKNDPSWCIVYDKIDNKRVSLFLPAKACEVTIHQDSNGIKYYELKYDIAQAVRVKPLMYLRNNEMVSYKNNYWVTETGLVIARKFRKVVALFLRKGDYLRFTRNTIGKLGTITAHRAVASTFLPLDDLTKQVNHIDGVKSNNHISNLEWVTDCENIQHAYGLGLIPTFFGENVSVAKLTNAQAEEIRNNRHVSREETAKRYNVSIGTIYNILGNKTYTQ